MRRDLKLRLETSVIEAIADHAKERGASLNATFELIAVNYAKSIGRLPIDFALPPETRGGRRERKHIPENTQC